MDEYLFSIPYTNTSPQFPDNFLRLSPYTSRISREKETEYREKVVSLFLPLLEPIERSNEFPRAVQGNYTITLAIAIKS
jgi:hypothetical protein